MRFENAYLPAGGYWSSPFSKWQGSLSALHPVKFAAKLAANQIGVLHQEEDPLAGRETELGRRRTERKAGFAHGPGSIAQRSPKTEPGGERSSLGRLRDAVLGPRGPAAGPWRLSAIAFAGRLEGLPELSPPAGRVHDAFVRCLGGTP